MFPRTYFVNDCFNPPLAARTRAAPEADLGLAIAAMALPDEPACRAELEQWLSVFPPASIADRVLVERLAVASIEQRRAMRARSALLAEKVCTAAYRFDRAQDQKVHKYINMLCKSPERALAGLTASAAGTRHLIGRWERLKAVFDVEKTWYGADRDEVTLLQGARCGIGHLAESETAYMTWLYCLLAQPKPREAEIRQMGDHRWMPKAFQDHDPTLWIPIHRHARMLLDELVTHELSILRARERWLRTHIEEPARAAALEAARVLTGPELSVLRNEQIHDQIFHRAYQALCRSRRHPAPRRPRAVARCPEPPAVRPPLLTDAPPKTDRETNTNFFDYHAARRAVLDEVHSPASPTPAAAPLPTENPEARSEP
jgi:hypothetical protein